MQIKSPILYCCYNRPDLVEKSIMILKKIQTNKIYIWFDGPKNNLQDIKNCNSVRKIIQNTRNTEKCRNSTSVVLIKQCQRKRYCETLRCRLHKPRCRLFIRYWHGQRIPYVGLGRWSLLSMVCNRLTISTNNRL